MQSVLVVDVDREAKREENAGLCRWLGIPAAWRPKDRVNGYISESMRFPTESACQQFLLSHNVTGYDPDPIYPALDTREHHLTLWDALPNPEFGNWIMTKLGRGKASVAYSVVCELIRKPGEFVGEVLAEGEGATPEAALYAAAQALRKREGASE